MALNHLKKNNLFRYLLGQFRQFAYLVLGIRHLRANAQTQKYSAELPTGEVFSRVMDRICILEAHVNWRLHGLPPKFCNLRIEELAILNSSSDLVSAVNLLSMASERSFELNSFEKFLGYLPRPARSDPSKILILASLNLAKNVDKITKLSEDLGFQVTWVLDADDLFLGDYESFFATFNSKIKTNLLGYFQSLVDKHFTGIWISDWFYRQSPLKIIVALKRFKLTLLREGKLGSLVINEQQFSLDPRMVKLTNLELCKLVFPSCHLNTSESLAVFEAKS